MAINTTTTVTYNTVAQRCIQEGEALEDQKEEKGTELANKTSSLMLSEMAGLLEAHHRGELQMEEYNNKLLELLAKHNEDIAMVNDLKPQLFEQGLLKGAGNHEDVHCAHVMPLLEAIQRTNAKKEKS